MTYDTTTVLSGLEYAWSVRSDGTDVICFLEHGRGNIWRSTTAGATPVLLTTVSGYGGHFLAPMPGPSPGTLFIADTIARVLWELRDGVLTAIASNFMGQLRPPLNGPTGVAYDGEAACSSPMPAVSGTRPRRMG